MRKPKPIPEFKSEEEEMLFWDEHDPSDYMTEPVDVIIDLKAGRKKMISVRIDVGLWRELKAVAEVHGLPYQRLMRELLRQSLRNLAVQEGRASGHWLTHEIWREEDEAEAPGRNSERQRAQAQAVEGEQEVLEPVA